MHTILFLAANPAGTERLALDQEARAIHAELERSVYRDRFQLVTRWAAQPLTEPDEQYGLPQRTVLFSAPWQIGVLCLALPGRLPVTCAYSRRTSCAGGGGK